MHNDRRQRTQWAQHLRDEADAIAEQQLSAGSTHEPVEGPLPHTRNDMAAAAQDAVRAERESCARLAASFSEGDRLLSVLPDASLAQLQAAAQLALHIAEALRTGAEHS